MTKFEEELAKLNHQQLEAVQSTEGPVLVVAGPGTGKTQILALRIANILQTTDMNASNILCLTFTDSGVRAMRDRLHSMIGKEAYYVRIHTFHSFANEVIQTHPEIFSFARELVQLDDLTRTKIIRKLISEADTDGSYLFGFFDKYRNQRNIVSAIQQLKREGVSPEELKAAASEDIKELEATREDSINPKTGKPVGRWTDANKKANKSLELAGIYQKYQEYILSEGYYDYEDMILFVVEKFQEEPDLLAYYQEQFQYIHVDEFQDTNGAQSEILTLLGSFDNQPNIFAVGDDDQAIYRFQGANVENLLQFSRSYSDTKLIPITMNYRSSQQILDLADSLISKNEGRLVNLEEGLEKNLESQVKQSGYANEVYELPNQDAENKFLTQKINELNEAGVELNEVAILYRRHKDAEDTVDALLRANIPIQLAAGGDALQEPKVMQLVNLLKSVEYVGDDRDRLLFEVLFYDFLGFSRVDVYKVTRFASQNKLSLFDVISSQDNLSAADIEGDELLEFSHTLIRWRSVASNSTISSFLDQIGEESGYLRSVFDHDPNPEEVNSVHSFYQYVRDLNRNNKELTLPELISDIKLMAETGMKVQESELELNDQGVQLMTVHSAKGLEFRYVFLIKFHSGNWGSSKRSQGITLPDRLFQKTESTLEIENQVAEDERRLLFVAITRAKEKLTITYAKQYGVGNSVSETSPSEFLYEFAEDLYQTNDGEDFAEYGQEWVQQSLLPLTQSDYQEEEKRYLEHILQNFRLSASSLNEYLECPLKFKFNRLLKVPTPKNRSLILGDAVHYVLEHFMRNLIKGDVKDKKYLTFLMEKYLERVVLSDTERSEILAEGHKLIKGYYDEYQNTFTAPVSVEYGFYDRNIVLEAKGMEPVLLSGKIDKIEWINEDQYEVRLVDYKTSSPKSANQILGRTKSSTGDVYRQLQFYKLLAKIDPKFKPAPNLPKYRVAEVMVDFVKPNNNGIYKRESFNIPDSEVDDLKTLIIDVMRKIRNLEFEGCGECEYCQMLEMQKAQDKS